MGRPGPRGRRCLTAGDLHPADPCLESVAAELVLLSLGETRSKHSHVIASFSRGVIGEGGLEPAMGELLRSLFEDRIDVDYRLTTAVRPARVSASMTPGAS